MIHELRDGDISLVVILVCLYRERGNSSIPNDTIETLYSHRMAMGGLDSLDKLNLS